ncbi:MAG: type II toxin-antitoxin system HicB family antitoxin, partial [bacterium]|nr:type II toxin-antitoxin system HicB family antitoxin [bacterium]
MGMLKYKGYTGSVEYSDEDKCLFGKIQGLHGTLISYEG